MAEAYEGQADFVMVKPISFVQLRDLSCPAKTKIETTSHLTKKATCAGRFFVSNNSLNPKKCSSHILPLKELQLDSTNRHLLFDMTVNQIQEISKSCVAFQRERCERIARAEICLISFDSAE